MSVGQLLLKEIAHRKLSFALGFLAVAAAAGLFIALMTMGRASNTETQRLMRNLGFNVLVLPANTDLADFWANDFVTGEMPQDYVKKLAGTEGVTADHYVATLQKKVAWEGMQVLLTGVLPEQTAVDARGKAPMGVMVERGKCYVGFAIASKLGLEEGDTIDLLGTRLQVERCLLEEGGKEDIRIYAHLADAQEILGMPDRINMIQALGCLCEGQSLENLRRRIGGVLPDTYVTELHSIVVARSETRRMVEQHVGFILSAVTLVCAAWVALLSLLNVRERRQEIGVLRALGFGGDRIGALILGRAALMGILGALVGFVAGTYLAMHFGPDIFKITFGKVKPAWDLFVPLVVGAPIISAVAGLLPAMVAVTQDPAAVLTEE